MWTDGNGFFYFGDMQPGHRVATPEEVALWESSKARPKINFAQWLALFTEPERAWAFSSDDAVIREMIARGAAENAIDLASPAIAEFLDLAISLGAPLTTERKTQVLRGEAP
jgi:hypothetical protein